MSVLSSDALPDDWLTVPCLCANVRRFARLVTRLYDEALRPVDMEIGQFGLTATIARLGPISQTELARGLAMDQTSLTRTLGVLEARGWIARQVGADRRRRLFTATEAGRRQVALARPHWRRAQQRLAEIVGPDLDHLSRHVGHASLALHAEPVAPAPAARRRPRRSAAPAT